MLSIKCSQERIKQIRTTNSKHVTLAQCWPIVGPASQTLAQHWSSSGPAYCIFWYMISWKMLYVDFRTSQRQKGAECPIEWCQWFFSAQRVLYTPDLCTIWSTVYAVGPILCDKRLAGSKVLTVVQYIFQSVCIKWVNSSHTLKVCLSGNVSIFSWFPVGRIFNDTTYN